MHKNSEHLEFPVFSQPMSPPMVRSMDEINEWIEQDYALFFNRERYELEKKKMSVNTIFILNTVAAAPLDECDKSA